ncbi:MAG: TetR/AcrR family transcriptional regulator [Nocardioides sp.]
MTSSVAADPHRDPRAKIVEAAARLLAEGGSAAVTTRAVAHAAGTAAPTIFRLFGDKDGLMDAVAEHVMATYVTGKSRQADLENGDPVEDLRDAWRTHIAFAMANPDLFVLLNTPRHPQRSPATTAGAGVLAARVRRVAAAGLLGVPESRAVSMIHAAGTGAVLALLHQPQERRDHSLPDGMLQAVLDAVLAENPAPPASDLVALAVALRTAVPELPALTEAERGLLSEWLTRSVAAVARRER